MQLSKRTKVAGVIGAIAGFAATATGVAFAVWSASGVGQGGAAATVAQPITVTAVIPSGAAAALYPGGPASQVYVKLVNPNPYAVNITTLAWGSPFSANTTSCPSSNFTIDAGAPTTMSPPISLAAGQTIAAFQIDAVVDLSHSAPDGCQGVGVYVPLTVTGAQQ